MQKCTSPYCSVAQATRKTYMGCPCLQKKLKIQFEFEFKFKFELTRKENKRKKRKRTGLGRMGQPRALGAQLNSMAQLDRAHPTATVGSARWPLGQLTH